MKTKINLSYLVVVMMFILNFTSKAQTYPFTNSLSCNVTVGYEVWDSHCSVCLSGNLLINAGTTQNLSVCAGYSDICIGIIDIGGDTPAPNHSTLNGCHMITPYGQTGTTSTSSSCGVINWSATQSTSGWIIQ